MKLTNHEEYGLRCLLRLAEQGAGGSLTIPQLSQAEGVSEAYTAKLLRMLRRSGFVKAARGKAGGYTLARPADRIVVADVMKVLGGPLFEGDFCEMHTGQLQSCVRTVDCSLRALWRRVQEAVDGVLSRTTLDSLLRDENAMVIWTKGFGDAGAGLGQTSRN